MENIISPDDDWNISKDQYVKISLMNTGVRVSKILNMTHFLEIRNNPESFEKWIQEMNYKTFIHLLIQWNGILRGSKKIDRDIDGVNVAVASWVPPSEHIKSKILRKTFDVVKKLENPNDRADLLTYMFQFLHIFNDGNGRLGRFIHSLLDGTNNLNAQYLTRILDHDMGGNDGYRVYKHTKHINPEKYYPYFSIFVNSLLFEEREYQAKPRVPYLNLDGIWNQKIARDWEEKSPKFASRVIQILAEMDEQSGGSDKFNGVVLLKFLIEKWLDSSRFIDNSNVSFIRLVVDEEFLLSLSGEDIAWLYTIHDDVKLFLLDRLIDVYMSPDEYRLLNGVLLRDIMRI